MRDSFIISLGQTRACVLDLRRLAYLPLTTIRSLRAAECRGSAPDPLTLRPSQPRLIDEAADGPRRGARTLVSTAYRPAPVT